MDLDEFGHGTHVAGTVGSSTLGVAKKTKLYAVKVLDEFGNGQWTDVIEGIIFSVGHYVTNNCPNGAVLNMSLGGYFIQSVNDAVAAAVDAGIFVAVAAGNYADYAMNWSPASEPKAFTVAASDSTDVAAYFTNYGPIVDAFAPGVGINSTIPNGAYVSIFQCLLKVHVLISIRNSTMAHQWRLHTSQVWQRTF